MSKRVSTVLGTLMVAIIAAVFSSCVVRVSGTAQPSSSRDCAIALAAYEGTLPIDNEIVRLQQKVRDAHDPIPQLEQLGWMFVEKARQSYDPGFYKIAEACAECMETKRTGNAEGLLIKGHALNSLHRFKDAEAVARSLVALRGMHLDYGLLGDSLMEQGRLNEAIDAYQQMVDLKPGPYSYARVAHIRWLKGDLQGAIEMMRLAARAAGPGEGESAAWNYTRLGLYEFQAGAIKVALAAIDEALQIKPGYAPALLARGRIALSQNRTVEACDYLGRAAGANPLPEYQWTLAEALRTSGRPVEAAKVEAEIEERGSLSDPRTLALYLATRQEKTDLALSLALEEEKTRADVFTLDAIAWSLASSGDASKAREISKRSLEDGTVDARLLYHAGVIASMAGDKQEARRCLNRAFGIRQMLLPSERERLSRTIADL